MSKKPFRILIADDEDGLRLAMGGILEMEGYEVVTVASGPEAVERARQESFDIAFLDIRMPGINGVDAFKQIKQHSPETVVVMMTAYAVSDLVKEAIVEGAYACISKPFDMDKVIETIKDVSAKPFVMVVDDDPHLCELLHDRFLDSGFTVVTRASGPDGIKAAQRRAPDVLFLDVVMEGMDGIETLKKMKETLGDKAPKTIVMSSYGTRETFENAKRLGAVECFQKPLNTARLNDLVRELTAHTAPGGRVCLVNTDQALCATLRDMLTANGYEVVIAATPEDALNIMKRDTFRIVVMDAQHAQGNGLEMYDRIKKTNPDMGVIFISGNDTADTVTQTITSNNFLYLHKPFEPESLLSMIDTIKNKRPTPQGDKS